MAFWLKVVFCYGLVLWPSGVVPSVMAFWLKGWTPPRRSYQKATFNQKATKPEGHNRRPHTPQEQTPPQRPAARHAGIPPAMHAGIAPPMNRMTNRCKNITLPQTSFAGGNNPSTPRPPLQARSLRETQSITAFA